MVTSLNKAVRCVGVMFSCRRISHKLLSESCRTICFQEMVLRLWQHLLSQGRISQVVRSIKSSVCIFYQAFKISFSFAAVSQIRQNTVNTSIARRCCESERDIDDIDAQRIPTVVHAVSQFSVSVVMSALLPPGSGEDGLNFTEFQRWFVNGDRQLLVHFGWAM